MNARRPVHALLLFATVALGLASRRMPALFPAFIATYGGDTLWAAMVYWLVALLRPRWTVRRTAALALTVSVLVELSQLYHAAWIDALRANRFAALVLGQGFLGSDIVCYAVGVLLAMLIDGALVRQAPRTAA